MSDERIRRLEREAAQGDPASALALGYEYLRTGTIERILPIVDEALRAETAEIEATELGKMVALAYDARNDPRTALRIAQAALRHREDPELGALASKCREAIAREYAAQELELIHPIIPFLQQFPHENITPHEITPSYLIQLQNLNQNIHTKRSAYESLQTRPSENFSQQLLLSERMQPKTELSSLIIPRQHDYLISLLRDMR